MHNHRRGDISIAGTIAWVAAGPQGVGGCYRRNGMFNLRRDHHSLNREQRRPSSGGGTRGGAAGRGAKAVDDHVNNVYLIPYLGRDQLEVSLIAN